MKSTIYLIDGEENLRALAEQPYTSEDLLQTLLEKYPALLSGDASNADGSVRWLLVAREIGVPGEEGGSDRWSLDHLFLDLDGIPTLVEVKRASDTRIRREVVGQMLDYAANAVVYWPAESIRARYEAGRDHGGEDANEVLADFLQVEPEDEDAIAAFWTRVRTNLQAGRIRMVFVADQIPNELKRIIEFLNGQTDPAEVLGVELRQYVGDGLRTLVPRVVGQTAEADRKKGAGKRISGGGPQTPTQQLQVEYWSAFGHFLREARASFTAPPVKPTHGVGWSIGRPRCRLRAYVSMHDHMRIAVGLHMTGSDADAIFQALQADRPGVERELGFEVEWEAEPDRVSRNVIVRHYADTPNDEIWPQLHRWTLEKLQAFERVFRPRVNGLDLPESVG